MPVQDWTRVEACIFHDLHINWISELQKTLNRGVLPEGFYALIEQQFGRSITDLLTLHTSRATGGIAVAEVPPRVRRRQTIEQDLLARRRSLAIRHVSGHRLIALVEIVSPANKDRARHVEEFVEKAATALELGVHLLLLDLLPPGPHDPQGTHGAILDVVEQFDEPYDLPADEPLTLASYAAGPKIDVYLEHIAVGSALPQMPLFLRPDRYVNVPLEPTYQSAYAGMPAFWRNVLEGQS